MEKTDTIAAISTGASSGAIAIVRLSGSKATKIADEIFSAGGKKPSSFDAKVLTLGTIETKNFKEQAMCVVFRAPHSYTGEDIVEFQCHGGTQIASGILKECLALGARLATNGEFTKRAFLNGKMTLSSAEGMIDMINAESDAEIRAGYELLSGNLSKLALDAQEELTDILSEIEVSFDYPEETIEYITKSNIKERLKVLLSKIEDVLSTAEVGKIIKSGITVLIVGKPNVGKSSLLNRLLGTERAIVTDIAGTTRDIVEGTFLLGDIKINLIDTAGIRETADKVEKIGVDKAKNLISSADIVLFLVDGDTGLDAEDEKVYENIKNSKHIVVITKSDLKKEVKSHFDNAIKISNITGDGIEALKSRILEMAKVSNLSGSNLIITNERHKACLESAKNSILRAITETESDSLDLVSIDIKQAYIDVGEITGNTSSEEIIDKIFSKFCLGK